MLNVWQWVFMASSARSILVLAAAVAAGGAVPAQPGAGSKPLPAGTVRFERAVVVDPSGMAQPMGAATLFIPYGWRTRGGVVWGRQHACTDYFNLDWAATSPDGLSSILLLPQAGWEMDNTGHANAVKIGCTKQPMANVQVYLQSVLRQRWPGASAQGFRRRPDLETRASTSPSQGGGQMSTRTEAGELQFVDKQQGRDMQGSVGAIVTFTQTSLPVQGMGNLQFLTASAAPGYAVVVPAGQLDFAYFERIRRSIQPNREWLQEVTRFVTGLRRNEQIEVGKRNQIWAETNAQIAALRASSWNASQRSADQRAADFSQTIRGVENYQGADGKKTELDAGFANAWKLNDGSYLMSTNPNFDAGRDLGLEGRRLDPKR